MVYINEGGIIIDGREDITSKMLTKHKFADDTKALFIEINFRKCNWLLYGLYHPPSESTYNVYSTYEKALETLKLKKEKNVFIHF